MASSAKVHLVTGAASEDHISSTNAGNMNAGVLGSGSYVLSVGNKMAARMDSANSLIVDTGTAVHNGRQIDVETPTTLTIDSGTQGQKRNDLVVLRYAKSGEYEDATIEVIKGTPTGSAPSDPSYNEGSVLDGAVISDMPLYRVPIDGITPGDPVPLFSVLVPYSEFQEDASVKLVESGHGNGWFWRKYSDGTCVMDGKLSTRATGGSSWGSIYYDSAIRGGESLPFALKSLTVGTVHVIGGNGSFWATQATSGTTTTTPTWYACRATRGTEGTNLQVAYHIVGTWK